MPLIGTGKCALAVQLKVLDERFARAQCVRARTQGVGANRCQWAKFAPWTKFRFLMICKIDWQR